MFLLLFYKEIPISLDKEKVEMMFSFCRFFICTIFFYNKMMNARFRMLVQILVLVPYWYGNILTSGMSLIVGAAK